MAYTSHGHHIPGTTVEGTSPSVARCGGPKLCATCARDAQVYDMRVASAWSHDPRKPAQQANPFLRHFRTSHLTYELAAVSEPFGDLARHLDRVLPEGDERDMAFRKLLEAKDCAVRSAIDKMEVDRAAGR
jgi:hypothetical protein